MKISSIRRITVHPSSSKTRPTRPTLRDLCSHWVLRYSECVSSTMQSIYSNPSLVERAPLMAAWDGRNESVGGGNTHDNSTKISKSIELINLFEKFFSSSLSEQFTKLTRSRV